jgi:membrane associated rhomboid family serine protease
VLVILSLVGCLVWRTSLVSIEKIAILDKPADHWWRLLTTPFIYRNTGYAFVAIATIAIYGWLLERRHGPTPVIALFAVGAIGGTAATVALLPHPLVLGANGGALALVIAWAIPDLLSLRRHEDFEGDLLGTAVVAVVVALMPLVVKDASWISDAVGIIGGLTVGSAMALAERY